MRDKTTSKATIYRVGKVPRHLWQIGDRQEDRFGRLGREYGKIIFDKTLLGSDPTLEWVTPGHPLFETVRTDVLTRTEESLRHGAVFFDLHRSAPSLIDVFAASIKDGRIPDVLAAKPASAQINLHSPALIPESIIDDVHTRLTLYKRIASAKDADSLRELQVEIIDRFGLLQAATKHLFDCAELRLSAERLGISKIDMHDQGGMIGFVAKPAIDPFSVIQLIQATPKTYAMQGSDRLKISNKTENGEQRAMFLRALLTRLGASTP